MGCRNPSPTRRKFGQTSGALQAAPALLKATRASAQDAVFKIGMVTTLTGPLAGFGEAPDLIIAGIQDQINGLQNNGKPVKIPLIAKDCQSNPNARQRRRRI